MNKRRMVLLASVALWLSGCVGERGAAATAAPPKATSAVPSPSNVPSISIPLLPRSSVILQQLSTDATNTIPDLVLNRAKCFVLIPRSSVDPIIRGAVTCRAGSAWSGPVLLTFSGAGLSRDADLLLFLMTNRPLDVLLGGSLDLAVGVVTSAGPMLRDGSTVTDIELTGKDILGYTRTRGLLSGAGIKMGIVRLDTASTTSLYGRKVTPNTLLSDSTPRAAAGIYQNAVSSFFNTITPVGIIIHHSVFIPSSQTAEGEVDRFHDRAGFAISCFGRTYHIAYHYLILPDGNIKAGRPERCEGAHARGYNSYLGIALVGDFSSEDNPTGKIKPATPTAKQMQSLVQLCQRLRNTYHIPIQRLMRHSDVARTKCPGDRFPFAQFLAELQDESHRPAR